jgi:hypothetical protein
MTDDTYCTMRSLGTIFGASSHAIGRALKAMGLHTAEGQPSYRAQEAGLVKLVAGPQSWIPLWLWHKEQVIGLLKKAGFVATEEDAS